MTTAARGLASAVIARRATPKQSWQARGAYLSRNSRPALRRRLTVGLPQTPGLSYCRMFGAVLLNADALSLGVSWQARSACLSRNSRPTRLLSRSAARKDDSSATGVRLVQAGQPLRGCLRSLLRNRCAVVSANSTPLTSRLLTEAHNPLSFTLSGSQGQ